MFSLRTHQNCRVYAILSILLISLAFVLVACGDKPSIKGKWEQISGAPTLPLFGGTGTVWEFFDDGTFSISVLGNISGKYSWPDSSHLRFEAAHGVGVVYELSQSGDELTLKDPSSQTVTTLRRYEELSPSTQSLAGAWERETLGDSQCFLGLGLDSAPQQASFGADGPFSAQQEGVLYSDGISLLGRYSLDGNTLHISATGTVTKTGLLGGTSQEQIGGESKCLVTVSHSRLLLKDDQGRVTLYVRRQQ